MIPSFLQITRWQLFNDCISARPLKNVRTFLQDLQLTSNNTEPNMPGTNSQYDVIEISLYPGALHLMNMEWFQPVD